MVYCSPLRGVLFSVVLVLNDANPLYWAPWPLGGRCPIHKGLVGPSIESIQLSSLPWGAVKALARAQSSPSNLTSA